MTLSEHVRTLGRGPGRSRSLTQEEALDAMDAMLSGQEAPEAVGALLMLLRMKGEIAEEIAGFAASAQAALPNLPPVDLDWPSYAAGRTRGAPWFLLSAKLVASAGYRVLLHGWNGADQSVRANLTHAGIRVASSPSEAAKLLKQHRIAYLPLETYHPALFRLLNLRQVLGLRSCINTVCRMLNPGAADASAQGVFHPSYRLLQADAAKRMGWDNLTVIKGGGGEFERHPAKTTEAFGLRSGAIWKRQYPAIRSEIRRLSGQKVSDGKTSILQLNPTNFETDIIISTAALALETLGKNDGLRAAEDLWNDQRATSTA